MRFWKPLSICIAIVLLLVSTVSAHRGKTDGNGGHYDHSTGEYHYHHGYPAHQHVRGVCPYNYDDQTGWRSGNSSGTSSSSSRDKQIGEDEWEAVRQQAKRQDQFKEQVTTRVESNANNKKMTFGDVVLSVLALLFALVFVGLPVLCSLAGIFYVILSIIFELPVLKRVKEKWEASQKEKQELKRQRAEFLRLEQWNAEKQNAVDFFDGESARQKACVPIGVMFSGDHWPISINGNSILVCPNKDMTRYHKPTCRYAKGITPISSYQIGSRCVPCSVCRPTRFAGELDWLETYRIYIQIKEDYEIEDPDITVFKNTSPCKTFNIGTSAKDIAQFDYLVYLAKMCKLSPAEFVAHINRFCKENYVNEACATENNLVAKMDTLKKEYQRALLLVDLKRIAKTAGYRPTEFLTAFHLSFLKQNGVSQTKAQKIVRTKRNQYKLL